MKQFQKSKKKIMLENGSENENEDDKNDKEVKFSDKLEKVLNENGKDSRKNSSEILSTSKVKVKVGSTEEVKKTSNDDGDEASAYLGDEEKGEQKTDSKNSSEKLSKEKIKNEEDKTSALDREENNSETFIFNLLNEKGSKTGAVKSGESEKSRKLINASKTVTITPKDTSARNQHMKATADTKKEKSSLANNNHLTNNQTSNEFRNGTEG